MVPTPTRAAARALTLAVALALCLGVAGCATIQVNTDFDPGTDFARYRSYDFLPSPKHKPRGMVPNPLREKRIRSAVDQYLSERGFDHVSRRPDFLIAHHLGARQKVDVETYGYRYGPRGRYRGREVAVRQYTEGTLIIDFIDADTRELFWRGTASGVVGSADEAAEKLEEAVIKTLEKYPPPNAVP